MRKCSRPPSTGKKIQSGRLGRDHKIRTRGSFRALAAPKTHDFLIGHDVDVGVPLQTEAAIAHDFQGLDHGRDPTLHIASPTPPQFPIAHFAAPRVVMPRRKLSGRNHIDMTVESH